MLYANWDILSTSWAPPAGSKPRPAEKPGKPENTYRQQYTSPRGILGSNPSTESNTNSIRKQQINMQMLRKESRLQPKAESQRISTIAQQQDLIKGTIISGHEMTTHGRCLRTPHQRQANVRKQYPNEASQQEESNATTIALDGAVYRRKSNKIRSLTQQTLTQLTAESFLLIQNAVVPTNPNDDIELLTAETRSLLLIENRSCYDC
ncbi:hypothetical protein F511_37203 [Dorcoceras hygrometricum]|uniref:Uncharacterized protein n=1 Tax=Dorcoceras hygrometricum TaxID=472368 RepID=A0A2Z7AYZ4_9LAMI|nr:hypothetical protein F511_37203 [Dorcoceras hygrometricum]